jgi:hypothetical protein
MVPSSSTCAPAFIVCMTLPPPHMSHLCPPPPTHTQDVERKFERYGPVIEARIVRDQRTGSSRGFGFVVMEQQRDQEEVRGGAGGGGGASVLVLMVLVLAAGCWCLLAPHACHAAVPHACCWLQACRHAGCHVSCLLMARAMLRRPGLCLPTCCWPREAYPPALLLCPCCRPSTT